MDFQKLSNMNKGYKYALICIDVFSRKGYLEPIKSKSDIDVLNAFKIIFKSYGDPQKLVTDNGSEFINKKIQEYFKSLNIYHETNEVGYHPALGIIDRFSQTLKHIIYKYFTKNNNVNWIDQIDDILESYNNTPHKSLNNLTPNETNNNFMEILKLNLDKNKQFKKTNFKSGQYVRIKLKKPKFSKGFKQIWSDEIYKIDKVEGINIILTNGDKININNLQIIEKPNEEKKPNLELKKADQESKLKKLNFQSGLDVDKESGKLKIPKYIVPLNDKRERKENVRLKDF